MIVVLLLLRALWTPAIPAIGLFSEVVAGGATYALTTYLLAPTAVRHLWALVRAHA
jgi:hypothetical protein